MFNKDKNKNERNYPQAAKRILILGSGFAGIEVLKRVQKNSKIKKMSKLH
jgi:hypothetical protein